MRNQIHTTIKRNNDSSAILDNYSPFLIKVADENNLIYDKFGIANEDDRNLIISVQEKGIVEPLVLSSDAYLLSGHRRLAASKYLRLKTVPVRWVEINFTDLSKDDRLKQLRLFNQQREKSPGERIREATIEIDKDAVYESLKQHRAERNHTAEINVIMGAKKRRPQITATLFLAAVKEVIADNKEYLPLTVRRVHYLLLNNPPLRHDSKPGLYQNDISSYKALTNLSVRARLSGEISMRAIEDSTRPIQLGGGFNSVQQFITQESRDYLMRYSRNLMMGQPAHIEIMLEKNALRTIIEKVAREYCIPVTTGRGFSSLPPRHELCQRYRKSGKDKLILLMLTDFDPDGDAIAATFARSLRDDFGIRNIAPVKVALTFEDTQRYDLPSDMDAKESSPNYIKFFERYGTKRAVELDAAPVELLIEMLEDAIESVIDVDEYNAQVDKEKADAIVIGAHRKILLDAIGGTHG